MGTPGRMLSWAGDGSPRELLLPQALELPWSSPGEDEVVQGALHGDEIVSLHLQPSCLVRSGAGIRKQPKGLGCPDRQKCPGKGAGSCGWAAWLRAPTAPR